MCGTEHNVSPYCAPTPHIPSPTPSHPSLPTSLPYLCHVLIKPCHNCAKMSSACLSFVLLLFVALSTIPRDAVSQYSSSSSSSFASPFSSSNAMVSSSARVCHIVESVCYPSLGTVKNPIVGVLIEAIVTAPPTQTDLNGVYNGVLSIFLIIFEIDLSGTNSVQVCYDVLVDCNTGARRLLQSSMGANISVSFSNNASTTLFNSSFSNSTFTNSTSSTSLFANATSLAAALQTVLASNQSSTLLVPANSSFVSIPSQNATVVPASTLVPSTGAAIPLFSSSSSSSFYVATPTSSIVSGNLCFLSYSVPGTVDYPFSVATAISFHYNSSAISAAQGTAFRLLDGSGSRTFTNKFGDSFTSQIVLNASHNNVLYVGSSYPVDASGVLLSTSIPLQLAGAGPVVSTSSINLVNASGVVVEGGASLFDNLGQAYLSTLPGFVNVTIGAANMNALAANYTTCQAPINFINGLRPPIQPSASNGAMLLSYSYVISDGLTYSVSTTLTINTTSAFATTTDQLGNPYQTVVNITGTRLYTFLPTGAQVSSVVTGLSNAIYAQPSQRFYPYSLLASSPGVYTSDTAPFLDGDGIGFSLFPSVPVNGVAPGAGAQLSVLSVFVSVNTSAVLAESYSVHQPLLGLQQQRYVLLK